MTINVTSVGDRYKQLVGSKVAEFIEVQTKSRAQTAGRRAKLVRSRRGRKVYRYRNTGQLARAITKNKEGKGYSVTDGTRANYSSGYHGMYFLVEKRGENDVKQVLKQSKSYTESLKL